MAIIGFLLAFAVCKILLKRKNQPFKNMVLGLPFFLLGGILIAKFFGILSFLIYCKTAELNVDFLYILKNSGWVFFGGMLGFFGAYLMLKKHLPYIDADVLAVTFPLFHSVARIGCYFVGCCYGKVLPVQLIESFLVFCIFLVLLYLHLKNKKGLLPLYILLYSVVRFFTEFLRGDEIRGVYILSFSQWISIILIVLFLGGTKWKTILKQQ